LYLKRSPVVTAVKVTSPSSSNVSILLEFSHLPLVELYFNTSLFATDIILTLSKSSILNVSVSVDVIVKLGYVPVTVVAPLPVNVTI